MSLESPEKLKETRGCNTEVRFTFIRHSQKKSGQVFTEGALQLSASSLSESGLKRASSYGQEKLAGRAFNKAYATNIDRTRDTLTSAFHAAGLEPKILQEADQNNAFFSLPSISNFSSPEFMDQYRSIMQPKQDEYVKEHFPSQEFSQLTPDQQEAAAEYAEEFALDWYLAFGDQKPDDKTLSPKELAAATAYKINRLINLPDYMLEGSEVDLISAGHKTSTEAFLKYVLKIPTADGKQKTGCKSLQEIGGSMKILDSWDLLVKNDENGQKSVTITLRRESGESQDYQLDMAVLNELVKEYLEAHNLKPKKIDSEQHEIDS